MLPLSHAHTGTSSGVEGEGASERLAGCRIVQPVSCVFGMTCLLVAVSSGQLRVCVGGVQEVF